MQHCFPLNGVITTTMMMRYYNFLTDLIHRYRRLPVGGENHVT